MEKEAGRKKFLQKKSKTDQGSSLPANASAAGSPVLCFDIDCEARIKYHCEVVGKDGDLLDELHQAEAIKTRIEQQMDSLDVNTAHYEKKIADLQRHLDSQYDTIDETEQAIAEVRVQILDLKKSSSG